MSELNVRALQKEEFVRALRAAGSRLASDETLQLDILSGAPVNEDGTIDFFKFGAWVLKKVNTIDGD